MKSVLGMLALTLAAGPILAACEQPEFTPKTVESFRPETPGSHPMLRAPIEQSDGLDVIISDVVIPPGGSVPWHYHPGEEFVYIIEGSAIHREEGKPDKEVHAGEAMTISPRSPHSPMGGPNGARAIVFRVHQAGTEERIPTDPPQTSE